MENQCKKDSSQEWNKDRVLRHPADFEAWKPFDIRHSKFANDPRNVWLGLASYGFNPFGTMRSVYTTWPVILMPYNLPPWLCMKEEFFILSLLIPGSKGPKNYIDFFLEPLIEELNDLWSVGIEIIDSFSKETFQLYLRKLKSYVRNLSCPEGSIAEAYIAIVNKIWSTITKKSYGSTSDSAPKSGNITYYGRLNDIVELNYYEKVVLFKCDWVDVTQGRGVMKDDFGFTVVNFSHLIHSGGRISDEPFVFPGQA
ncbi:hypothetical protein RDI58_010858 [Solanum bulbocastanum]|uniref:DUF4216 domain-containing protein n=1 Tax=Solanum bulbocastanum TaxID=147425 RepID=A0AAN8TUK1_SOLBU